jgi:type II secretory pathway component GspD/PulD (secretin)
MSRRILFVFAIAISFLHGVKVQAEEVKASPPANTSMAIDFEAILRQPIKVEFADTPLADSIDYLGKQLDINILLDPKGLTDAAVDPAAPVTLALRNPVSVEAALRLILEPFDLTFTVQDEILKITTKEKADEILTTKVYSVGDLLDRGPRRGITDNLLNTITGTIQPDTWEDNGGPGSVYRLASTLVISQKYDVHKELQNLFAMLRAELPKRADNAATGPNPNETTTVVYKLEHASGQDAAEAIRTAMDPTLLQPGGIAVVKMRDNLHSDKADHDRSWDALVVRQKPAAQTKVQEFLEELGQLHQSRFMMSSGPRGPAIP